MVTRVAIVGVTGYSGGELCALLSRHGRVTLDGLYSSASSSRTSSTTAVPFQTLHPALRGKTGPQPWPQVQPFSLDDLLNRRPDAVLLATPNETSAELVPRLVDSGMTVVDLSGAYRLSDSTQYPGWYGFIHPRPELLPKQAGTSAVYGLPERSKDNLLGARLVANPGCYPTSILLALLPISELVDWDLPVVCDSKSGVSGAGKKSELAYSFTELSSNFKAYGVGTHRHEPEIREQLGLSKDAPFSFVPHLLPVTRGILSTIHVSFPRPVLAGELWEHYQAWYAQTEFVGVRTAGELPELRDVVGTPRAEIGFAVLSGGRRAVLVSVLDNLLKGAASQAIQNLNLALGFDEKEGLL